MSERTETTLRMWREPDFYMEVPCKIEGDEIQVPSIEIPAFRWSEVKFQTVPWWRRVLNWITYSWRGL